MAPDSNFVASHRQSEAIKHRSFGPSRLVDSALEVPVHWAGSLAGGFMGGLIGNRGGKQAADWVTGQRWFQNIAAREGGQFAQAGVDWLSQQGTSSIWKMAGRSASAGWEGARSHFAVHSPFAWGASGIQLAGKSVGGTLMSTVGQVAGEATGGLVTGAAWLGATLLAGTMRAIPKWGNIIRGTVSAGAKKAAGGAMASNAEAILTNVKKAGRRVLGAVVEPITTGEGRNLIEALSGYRLKKGVEGATGRALAYGMPIAAFGGAMLTAKGRIEMEPLANRQTAGVVGSTYAPRPGPNNLGATGDLTLALHGLR